MIPRGELNKIPYLNAPTSSKWLRCISKVLQAHAFQRMEQDGAVDGDLISASDVGKCLRYWRKERT